MKKNKYTKLVGALMAISLLGVGTQNLSWAQSSGAASTPAASAGTAAAKSTAPAAANSEYQVRDLVRDKKIQVGTPLEMTERFNDDMAKKKAPDTAVGPITRSTSGSAPVNNGAEKYLNSALGGSKAATGPTPAGVASATTAVKPDLKVVETKTETKTTPKADGTTATSSKTTTTISPISSETLETVDSTSTPKTLKAINELKTRLDLLKIMQDVREAEHKLKQPIVDKNSTDSKNAGPVMPGGNTMSSAGNIVSPVFNPVIKGGIAGNNAPVGMAQNSQNGLMNNANGIVPATISAPPNTVTVYSIIGFDGQYSAKLTIDGKSTYTVKKGDVLPDGQLVTEITPYYLIVAEKTATGRPLAEPQRVYVTGKPLSSQGSAATAGTAAATQQTGTQRSAISSRNAGMVGLPTPNAPGMGR